MIEQKLLHILYNTYTLLQSQGSVFVPKMGLDVSKKMVLQHESIELIICIGFRGIGLLHRFVA
jgi:hypothetical protein